MAKLANTSATVIALVFLVMNLEAIMLSSCLLVLAVALVLLDRQPLEPVFAGFATR